MCVTNYQMRLKMTNSVIIYKKNLQDKHNVVIT